MPVYTLKRTYIGQLPHGSDLYGSLSGIVVQENIRMGRIQAIGATTHAVVAYYHQESRKYLPVEFTGGMEILSCIGNVSLRDGKPFVHVHITLGDAEGKAIGGHLMPGTTVFACEVNIEEFEGESLVREHDERTGLHLWSSGSLL